MLCLYIQIPEDAAEGANSNSSTAGSIGSTANMATELADVSHELRHYMGLNESLLQQYSQELLHVQSLAAQLVQMSAMRLD